MRVEDFDVRAYLDRRGIPYSTAGDNVSRGWIGISCVFCSDHSNHLGINLARKTFNCLKCHETGNIVKLIKELEGFVSIRDVFKLMEEFTHGYAYDSAEKVIEHHWQESIKFPPNTSKDFLPGHLRFLENRRYDPETVIKKFDLYAVGPVGDFSHRILLPIYFKKRMVSFLGRDVTGLQEIKYKNAPDKYGTRPTKDCLYNFDSIYGNKAIIVEGALDAWRLGDGAVATLGTKYTIKQLRLLKGLKRVFVLFDQDAINLAHKLAYNLSTLVKEVEVIELDHGDPDNLTDEEAKYLKKQLIF